MKDKEKIMDEIESKAKAYDEAIKVAKSNYETIIQMDKDCTFAKEGIVNTFHHMFPELKESEDERIRKALIKFFSTNEKWDDTVSSKDVLAWLEKQGKNKDLPDVIDRETLDEYAYQVAYDLSNDWMKETPTWDDVETACKLGANWIEKQGEKNSTEPLIRDQETIYDYIFASKTAEKAANKVIQDNRTCVEQRSIDKVEPKFHEGEWLCENEPNNYARFIQILEIVNVQGKDRYKISRDIHNDEDIVEFDFVEKHYHKFNIKDAKDGDVLQLGICTVIFKKLLDNNAWCYCSYTEKNGFDAVTDNDHIYGTGNESPATKEQRDTLEKAMTNAGYVWDADNKELRKIEDWSTWSEEDEKIIKRIDSLLYSQCKFHGSEYEEIHKWLKNLKNRV